MASAYTLFDDFNDNVTDTTKWVPFGPVQEINHRLEIRPPSNSVDVYGGYISVSTYDLRLSEVKVEIAQAMRGGLVGLRATTGNDLDTGDSVEVQLYQQNTIYAYQRVGGVETVLARTRPEWNAPARWLRLAGHYGVLALQVSADGEDWIDLYRGVPPIAVTSVKLIIYAGTLSVPPRAAPGVAILDNFNARTQSPSRRVEERRQSALDTRVKAAKLPGVWRHYDHLNNNDEINYPDRLFAGNFSKSLKHDSLGDPDPGSYATLLRALQTEDPGDFDEIILASSTALKLTNPQSGLAFDVEGPDAQEFTIPPAPRFDSQEAAHEAGELYWMAVARDVHFAAYGTDPLITAAISSLNGEFPEFGGTAPVTAQNVFRGIYPGEQVGPYVSQFLLKGNNDPRKPDGLGRDANEGYVSYGAQVIDQRIIPAATGVNYLTSFSSWLDVQNGVV
jgi:hypothetical protein